MSLDETPRSGADPAAAPAALADAPGPLTKNDWRRFHLRHCELHLGHVVIDDEP